MALLDSTILQYNIVINIVCYIFIHNTTQDFLNFDSFNCKIYQSQNFQNFLKQCWISQPPFTKLKSKKSKSKLDLGKLKSRSSFRNFNSNLQSDSSWPLVDQLAPAILLQGNVPSKSLLSVRGMKSRVSSKQVFAAIWLYLRPEFRDFAPKFR